MNDNGMIKHNFAVIMAGGIGARFWPMSREYRPKQFIDILNDGSTLIQKTFARLSKVCLPENIFVATNERYRQLVQEQLPQVPVENILCEPFRRNTAPCICYAYNKIGLKDEQARIVVAPSDHIILDESVFCEVIETSLETAAKHDCLITIGINPSRPDTGYGYIEVSDDKSLKLGNINKVKSFHEKPNLATAVSYLKHGGYFWNAGIFVWSAKSVDKAFKTYLPEMADIFAAGRKIYNTKGEQAFVDEAWEKCQNISIDYGILEKADNVYSYCADFGWSDLGTWGSLYDISDKDGDMNVAVSDVVANETQKCIIRLPEGKNAIIDGLDGYIVVDDGKSLLICRMENEQNIKNLVEKLPD